MELQLSIFHFGFEGLIVNEVRYLSLVDKKYGLNIEVPGSAILSSFGFNVLALWDDVAGLGLVCGVFLVLGSLSWPAIHWSGIARLLQGVRYASESVPGVMVLSGVFDADI